MGKPELSVTAELSVTEPLNVKLPPLNLVEEGKPDRAFDPMSYLEMVDGEWQVTAHGRPRWASAGMADGEGRTDRCATHYIATGAAAARNGYSRHSAGRYHGRSDPV